jgi:hypothetical protein
MKNVKKFFIGIAFLILLFLVLLKLPENRKAFNSPHFRFLFSNSIDTGVVQELAAALENNYYRIGNDLHTSPSPKIETNLYAERWRYIIATKNWAGSGNIEGVARLHFMQRAWGEEDNKKVALHEFTHTVVLKLLLEQEPAGLSSKAFDDKFSGFPPWLWEAIPVYEADQFVDPKTLPYLTNGKYPSLKELSSLHKGGKIYTCGYTLVEYMLAWYGRDKFIELIKNYGAVEKVFGVSENQFLRDWSVFLKERYL